VDPSSPTLVQTTATTITGALTEAEQPDALLLAASPGAWWIPATPRPQVSISLSQPAPRVDVQLAGNGTVQGLSNGTVVAISSFNSSQLATVTVNALSASQLIDQIQVNGTLVASPFGYVLAIGVLTLHPLVPDAIGTRYAIIPPPVAIQPVAAPGQPYTTFRHRQADIDASALTLVPHSLFDVEWPAPPIAAAQQTGDPVTDPLQLPPPTLPIGFVAQREDSGVAGSAARVPGWIATRSASKPKGSNVLTANLYRLVDSQLADPVGGWSHRVAGFDLFGALGTWSNWSAARGVEKIAAAPTAMRVVQFDNSAASGGAAAADGSAWIGGTLNLLANWAGASFMMYPDIATARITVEAIDTNGNVTGQLATKDLAIPKPTIQQLTVASMVAAPSGDGASYTVTIQTTPPLVALASTDPGQVLMLTLPDSSSERYTVRPAVPASAGLNATTPVQAILTARLSCLGLQRQSADFCASECAHYPANCADASFGHGVHAESVFGRRTDCRSEQCEREPVGTAVACTDFQRATTSDAASAAAASSAPDPGSSGEPPLLQPGRRQRKREPCSPLHDSDDHRGSGIRLAAGTDSFALSCRRKAAKQFERRQHRRSQSVDDRQRRTASRSCRLDQFPE
jgi:hypothetical protein